MHFTPSQKFPSVASIYMSSIKWLKLKVVLFSKFLSDEVQTLHDLKAWIRSCVQGGIRL